jgi:pyruvate formate lyase activating enzyme
VTPMTPTGTTFNVQRFSIRDGPGIRTTLFFKGCPLHCTWCHNPEGISPQPELVWYDVRCVGARDCLGVCPWDALDLTPHGMLIDRGRCDICGACVEACPAGALDIIGQSWTPRELLVEVQKDAVFFETSGGGVTLSGGEPMAQVDFLLDFCRLCQEAELHVALDTCGLAAWEDYQKLLPFVDLVLYDLKILDSVRHQAITGTDNVPMWVRTPIIPGTPGRPELGTADEANIAGLADFIASELPGVERWELLAFSNLGQPKYGRLDLPYALEGVPLLTRAELEALHALAAQRVPVAVWSGATRLEVMAAGTEESGHG